VRRLTMRSRWRGWLFERGEDESPVVELVANQNLGSTIGVLGRYSLPSHLNVYILLPDLGMR
jgi:hypothetical protein